MYQPIETAPKDGTIVRVKTASYIGSDLWSFRAKWIDGKWHADFGSGGVENWQTFDPQPLFWRPMRSNTD